MCVLPAISAKRAHVLIFRGITRDPPSDLQKAIGTQERSKLSDASDAKERELNMLNIRNRSVRKRES